jgi:hypothetical protein
MHLLLLWLLVADVPATSPADPIAVNRKPPTVEYVTIDRAHRPSTRPANHDAEDAWCQSFFNCEVKLKYEIVNRQTTAAGSVTVEAQVRRVNVTLTLNDTIYLPKPRTQKLAAHEEGHQRINERVYSETAEAAARKAAEQIMLRTWTATAANEDAAGKLATDQAVKALGDTYLKETASRAYDIGERYDELTSHGTRIKPSEDEAIRQAFSESR